MRIAIGTIAFAAPRLSTRPLLRDAARTPGSKLLARAFAVRDIAIGVGTLQALRENRDPKPWVQMGALCDAGDSVAMVAGLGKLPLVPSIAALASATTAAATGWRASAHLDSDTPTPSTTT